MDHILVSNVEQTDEKLNASDLIWPTIRLTWDGLWKGILVVLARIFSLNGKLICSRQFVSE